MGLDNGVKLTWVGHATWILETAAGTRILIDPWMTGNPVAPESLHDPGKVDLIALTHGHSDHIADAERIAKATNAPVVGMIELASYLAGKGVENTVGFNKGGTIEAAGIKVTLVDAHHSSSIEDGGQIVYLGEPAGLILTLEDGYRVYVAGDTCVFGDMALIGRLYKPDLAILPIGDFFTMGPFEAAEAIRLLGVTKVVPSHYKTFPIFTGTPDGLRDAASDVAGLEVLDVEPGGTIS